MWELDYKESWAPKNWCFWTVVLEKTLGSPLDCKEIKSVNPKGNQSWIFIGRTDDIHWRTETPILWPPDAKNWLIGKDPDARKDWRQEEKGMTEHEMVGWHHRLNRWVWATLGAGDGQRSLACCSPWGRKESDTTERLNWTELKTLPGSFRFWGKHGAICWVLSKLLALLVPSFHVRLCDIPSNSVISLWSSLSGGCCDKKPIPCENHCGTGNEWWCPTGFQGLRSRAVPNAHPVNK